jgi:hypothetical protein
MKLPLSLLDGDGSDGDDMGFVREGRKGTRKTERKSRARGSRVVEVEVDVDDPPRGAGRRDVSGDEDDGRGYRRRENRGRKGRSMQRKERN